MSLAAEASGHGLPLNSSDLSLTALIFFGENAMSADE